MLNRSTGEPGDVNVKLFDTLAENIKGNRLCALVTVVGGEYNGGKLLVISGGTGTKDTLGSLGNPQLDVIATAATASQMDKLTPARVALEFESQPLDLFIDVYPPPLRLVIVGAVHIAIPLVTFAKLLGFYTIVVDARSTFATRERFPHADQLTVKWPSEALEGMALDEGTCVVTLTHDEKLDSPALAVAVRSKARYVGALGSPPTHSKRVEALKELGLTSEEIARIHAPVGLNIGAKSTEEIGLAIMAEIVSVLHGKTP
jgi:xanthine dehydrogenase accessory factor